MTLPAVLMRMRRMANAANVAGMKRFAIRPKTRVLGMTIWELRNLAKEIGRDHRLARGLWTSDIHEAQILASYIEDPAQVTDAQLERWVAGFDSWDICDQVVELFAHSPFAKKKIIAWSKREQEFVKRAAFALSPNWRPTTRPWPMRSSTASFPSLRGRPRTNVISSRKP